MFICEILPNINLIFDTWQGLSDCSQHAGWMFSGEETHQVLSRSFFLAKHSLLLVVLRRICAISTIISCFVSQSWKIKDAMWSIRVIQLDFARMLTALRLSDDRQTEVRVDMPCLLCAVPSLSCNTARTDRDVGLYYMLTVAY